MVHGVHGGHHGQQDLGGADVRRRLFAADMLFTSLQGETVSGLAFGIDGDADEATGEGPFIGVLHCKIRRVGPAVAHGDAEALGGAEGDIGTEFVRRREEGEGEGVAGEDGEATFGLDPLDGGAEVAYVTEGIGVLEESAEEIAFREGVPNDDGPAQGFSAGFEDGEGLGVNGTIDEEARRAGFGGALRDGHGFCGGGAFVEHGGVGDVETGEVADHRLVVEEGFEAALADFGLVGCVGGVPGWILEDVALDDAGDEGAVVTLADEGRVNLVLGRDAAQKVEGFGFGHGRAGGERGLLPDGGRQGLAHQVFEGSGPDDLEHGFNVRR